MNTTGPRCSDSKTPASPSTSLPRNKEPEPPSSAPKHQPVCPVFRVKGRRLLHLVAHQEYGVVFSHCGMRVTAFDVEMGPEDGSPEDRCGRCNYRLQHG